MGEKTENRWDEALDAIPGVPCYYLNTLEDLKAYESSGKLVLK